MLDHNTRHVREKNHFDIKFKKESKRDFYSAGFTNIIFEKMMEEIGDIEDKIVLDFGCGSGWFTRILARKGAQVYSFDISQEAVDNLWRRSSSFNSKHPVSVDRMAAEKLTYKSDYFDLIVGVAILHHTDLTASINEIHRVLKSNGKAYFMEPLGHNKIINWYRKWTPDSHTPDEKPLHFGDFAHIKQIFRYFYHDEYYLTALLGLLWHFVFKNDPLMLKTRNILSRYDRYLLRKIPFLRKYCWYSLLVMEK